MSRSAFQGGDLVILHHYDFSPFAEKVRLMLGLKGLRWASVTAPSVLPKPDLVALTGGYRHIPVLQIGADVYCDTRTIARELDRRFPSPPLQAIHGSSLPRVIEAWVERDLFWPIARFVSGVNAETVDAQLHVDRARLRGKETPTVGRLQSVARRSLAQIRAQLAIVEGLLDPANPILSGQNPELAEFAVYHGLWFLSAFKIDCSGELEPYPRIREWMGHVAAIGHGEPTEMTAEHALQIAQQHEPSAVRASVSDDSVPALHTRVGIRPDDYATQAVEGVLQFVDRDDVGVLRHDARLGNVMVYFPRVGYAIKELD